MLAGSAHTGARENVESRQLYTLITEWLVLRQLADGLFRLSRSISCWRELICMRRAAATDASDGWCLLDRIRALVSADEVDIRIPREDAWAWLLAVQEPHLAFQVSKTDPVDFVDVDNRTHALAQRVWICV